MAYSSGGPQYRLHKDTQTPHLGLIQQLLPLHCHHTIYFQAINDLSDVKYLYRFPPPTHEGYMGTYDTLCYGTIFG